VNDTATRPTAEPPPVAPPDFTGAPAIPPLLPVLIPLVVAAIVLAGAFAYLFPTSTRKPAPVARLTNVTAEAGIRLPMTARADAPTTLGGGVAVLDYDNDGRPDLLFVNGAPWPWEEQLFKQPGRRSCALFHNDGDGHFSDVTARAGLDVELQGMSAAVGDFDNDGLVDLFVTCVGSNHLFHNLGGGRFEDVTESAGVGGDDQTWSTGAAWIDIDGDGRLDLVVVHYARWSAEVGLELAFTVARVGRSYGTPTGFLSVFPSVYRNLGNGRFELVPNSAGLRNIDAQTGLPVEKPLAVVPVDANGDGRLDLLFAYHTSDNALFISRGDGTFRKWNAGRDERHEGASVASPGALPVMGGLADQHLQAFEAAAVLTRAGAGDVLRLTGKLAIAPMDYDLDGRIEFFASEALAEPDVNRFEQGRSFGAVPRLYWNDASEWKPAPVGAPGAGHGVWPAPLIARGVAVADFDGDGDLDVVIAQNGAPPVLLRNDQRLGAPWLRIRLVATRTQHEAGGAQVEVHTPRRVFVQTVAPRMGFMAQSESTLTFGLGDDARVRRIVVRWPSGQRQEIRPVAVNQLLVIREP
jgi:hypothetical protein